MVEFYYIPYPNGEELSVKNNLLPEKVRDVVEKPFRKLMRAVSTCDAADYVATKTGKEIQSGLVPKGINSVNYNGGSYYRKVDLDTLVADTPFVFPGSGSLYEGNLVSVYANNSSDHFGMLFYFVKNNSVVKLKNNSEARRKKSDLKERLAAYRSEHGVQDEVMNREIIDGRLHYTTIKSGSLEELDLAVRESLLQAEKLENLKSKKLTNDLATIVTGDSIIDFLVRRECFPVAEAYAHAVYEKALEGAVWPVSDLVILKKKEFGRWSHKKSALFQTEGRRLAGEYVKEYEIYQTANNEDALVDLYKGNVRLSRGYIASVCWYLSEKNKKRLTANGQEDPDWNSKHYRYKPRWKSAWKRFISESGSDEIIKKILPEQVEIEDRFFQNNSQLQAIRKGYFKIREYGERSQAIIIEKHKKFGFRFAGKFEWMGLSFEDRANAAEEGLVKASEKFEPTFDYTFRTYSAYWIRRAIQGEWIDSLNVSFSMNMIEKYMKVYQTFWDIKKGKNNFNLSFEKVLKEIMERTEYSEEMVRKCFESKIHIKNKSSLDDFVGDDEMRLENFIGSIDADLDADFITRQRLGEALKKLDERERMVIGKRCLEEKTFEEIGEEYLDGLSGERIRQIEEGAKKKIRTYLSGRQSRFLEKDKYVNVDRKKVFNRSPELKVLGGVEERNVLAEENSSKTKMVGFNRNTIDSLAEYYPVPHAHPFELKKKHISKLEEFYRNAPINVGNIARAYFAGVDPYRLAESLGVSEYEVFSAIHEAKAHIGPLELTSGIMKIEILDSDIDHAYNVVKRRLNFDFDIEQFSEALGRFPSKSKFAFILYYGLNCELSEIAKYFGTKSKYVWTLCHKTEKDLRILLKGGTMAERKF